MSVRNVFSLGHLPCKLYFCTWILAVECFHSSTYTGIRIDVIDVSVFMCKCGSVSVQVYM